jgi:hypothetical protein
MSSTWSRQPTSPAAPTTPSYTEHPGRPWSREDYHDGQFHTALLILAYADGVQAAGLDEREQLRCEEEAASLSRRVLVALDNEADELHLSRFYTVTGRAHHALARARTAELLVATPERGGHHFQEVAS